MSRIKVNLEGMCQCCHIFHVEVFEFYLVNTTNNNEENKSKAMIWLTVGPVCV